MKKLITLALFCAFAASMAAQPAIRSGTLLKLLNGDTSYMRSASDLRTWIGPGTGTVTSFSAGTTGFSVANATTTPTISGTLVAANGGTGNASYAVGDLLQASASTTLTPLASVATGNVLISGGVTTVSSWGKVGLTTHVSGTLPVANGGSGLTSLGGDVTLLGSNGSANVYFTPQITTTSAAIAYARSGSTLNLNIPDADASFRGTVSTGTQTFAGAKTFSAALVGSSTVTASGLLTGSAGVVGAATSSVAAINSQGVADADQVAVVTSNLTLDHTHNFVPIGTLSANITISLPACNSTRDGWEYRFQKEGSDAFAFILDPNSTETFTDGASTKLVYSQGSTAFCKCRSSDNKWYYRAQ